MLHSQVEVPGMSNGNKAEGRIFYLITIVIPETPLGTIYTSFSRTYH